MRGVFGLLLAAVVTGSLAACAVQPVGTMVTTPRTYEGAAATAALGAGAGALIDDKNPWRGAVIGGAFGAVVGGTLTEISSRAARDVTAQGRPAVYPTGGDTRVETYPYGTRAGCRQVREQVYHDGQLVSERIREVC